MDGEAFIVRERLPMSKEMVDKIIATAIGKNPVAFGNLKDGTRNTASSHFEADGRAYDVQVARAPDGSAPFEGTISITQDGKTLTFGVKMAGDNFELGDIIGSGSTPLKPPTNNRSYTYTDLNSATYDAGQIIVIAGGRELPSVYGVPVRVIVTESKRGSATYNDSGRSTAAESGGESVTAKVLDTEGNAIETLSWDENGNLVGQIAYNKRGDELKNLSPPPRGYDMKRILPIKKNY